MRARDQWTITKLSCDNLTAKSCGANRKSFQRKSRLLVRRPRSRRLKTRVPPPDARLFLLSRVTLTDVRQEEPTNVIVVKNVSSLTMKELMFLLKRAEKKGSVSAKCVSRKVKVKGAWPAGPFLVGCWLPGLPI